jgi:serine protease
MAGTSMATPAVSGVAALLYAQCRDRANVLAAIESTATVPLVGRTSPLTLPAYGRGIVDAAKAVTYEGATC